MRPRDALTGLGVPASVREAATSYRADHGRGTSRWLAQEFGVSQRTAQRWLAGTQQPRDQATRRALTQGANQKQVRVDALRTARGLNAGVVSVVEKSPGTPGGKRSIGAVECDFSGVAEFLESGGTEAEAEAMMSDIVLDAYGESRGGSGVGDFLAVSDYGSFDLY